MRRSDGHLLNDGTAHGMTQEKNGVIKDPLQDIYEPLGIPGNVGSAISFTISMAREVQCQNIYGLI
jgi:hypothetical protein